MEKGDIFYDLTIIKEVEKKIYSWGKRRQFLCKCICGNKIITQREILIKGERKNCGCKKGQFHKTHGISHTPIWNAWKGMKRRINDKKHRQYKDYGGRGLVYERAWEKFENFLVDMGDTWEEGLTLDRIYNDWGYSKENCRWATRKEQQRNMRTNVMYKGKCLTEWCEELGLNYKTINNRILRGWSIKKALFTK